jgi:hypothetical protein
MKYIDKKKKDIEGEVAIAVGVANMVGCMFGKCTDGVINARDEATRKIHKIVDQIIKRVAKE